MTQSNSNTPEMDKYYDFILEDAPVTVAEHIAYFILRDVTDRRGWRQEFDQFDDDIREGILQTWKKGIDIILQARASELMKGTADESHQDNNL